MMINNDNLEDYSKLLLVYDIESDDKASKFLRCYLCHKIMINACNGPCGCLYCFECIINYLVDNHEFCPRNDSQCMKVKLNSNNLRLNSKINERISKLLVKCPMKFCNFKDELCKINNHFRMCEDKFLKCPFSVIGCKSNSCNGVNEHMIDENNLHSKLLVEFIFNLRNENLLLKETVVQLTEEIGILKTDIQKINQQINETKIKNEPIFVSENKIQETIDTLMRNYENLNNKLIEYKQNFQNEKCSLLDLETKIYKKIEENEEKNQIYEKKESQILTDEINVIKQNQAEFVWIINNWNDKIQQSNSGVKSQFYSDSFYTHKYGYKICLRVSLSSSNHLSILYCVMRGEYNDILPWPCKFDVTFQLFDQESGSVHVSKIIKYDSNPSVETHRKPIEEINIGRGFQNFISINEIMSNKGLSKNDKIIIRCLITSIKY